MSNVIDFGNRFKHKDIPKPPAPFILWVTSKLRYVKEVHTSYGAYFPLYVGIEPGISDNDSRYTQ